MLDDLQKQTVAKWIEDGAGLSEVQRRIKDEFGVSMTYMDVRFLVLDLGAQVKDRKSDEPRKESKQDAEAAAPVRDGVSENGDAVDESSSDDGGENPLVGGGAVTVDLDRVVRAGAMASGTVTFSDGVTGSWYLDRMGRLGLTKVSKPDYQPSREDLEAFQMELQNKLSAY